MDIYLFLAALTIGSASTILAYRIGGRSWIIKFAIRGPLLANGKRDRKAGFKPRSGLYAELAVQGLILTIMLFVSFITPDASILGVLQSYPLLFIGLLTIVTLIVIAYEIYISRKIAKTGREPEHKAGRGPIFAKRLARGYIPYTLYSIISFFAIVIVVALISVQTLEHYNQYTQAKVQLDALILLISDGALTPDAKMVLVEQIYVKVLEGASFMVDQINTLVLLIFCSFALQYTVKHTPLAQVFEADAILQFDVLLYLSIGFIALYAWSVHFFVYESFFEGALIAMDKNRAVIAEGGWEMLGRFHRHYLDLIQRQGLTGFMLSLTSDRGGLLLALGAAGWIIDKRRTKNLANKHSNAAAA